MNLLLLGLLIIFSIVCLMGCYVILSKKQFERFYRFARFGDPCVFRLNGKTYRGTIEIYEPDNLYSYVRDEDTFLHRVFSNEISPVFTYNYKN